MKLKRIHAMEKFINQYDSVSLTELTEEFDVSMNTVRRDIDYLEKNGVVEKVYGGVVPTKGRQLTSYNFRNRKNNTEKNNIAKLASSKIKKDDLVFIDSGTTTSTILQYVDPELQFTVLTNNLDVILSASKNENINLIVLGSKLYHRTRSLLLNNDESFIDSVNINKAFMAATGITIEHGLTNSNFEEQRIKQKVINRAEDFYVLVDTSKFGQAALLTYSPLDKVDVIITDSEPSEEMIIYCSSYGIKIDIC